MLSPIYLFGSAPASQSGQKLELSIPIDRNFGTVRSQSRFLFHFKALSFLFEIFRDSSPILLQGIGTGSSGSLLNIGNKAIYFNLLTRGTPIAVIIRQRVGA